LTYIDHKIILEENFSKRLTKKKSSCIIMSIKNRRILMIKAFKVMSKILLIVAVILFCASLMLPGITQETIDMSFLAQLLSNTGLVIGAVLGPILIYSNNDTVKRVGHGLTGSAFVLGFALAVINLNLSTSDDVRDSVSVSDSASAVVMLVAAVVLALSYVFNLIIFIMNNGATENVNPTEDIRVIRIKEWKQLMEEGIITREEYEEKRVQILGIKPKNERKI